MIKPVMKTVWLMLVIFVWGVIAAAKASTISCAFLGKSGMGACVILMPDLFSLSRQGLI
jgi:hypothetical protein